MSTGDNENTLFIRLLYTPDLKRTVRLFRELTPHALSVLRDAFGQNTFLAVREIRTVNHDDDAAVCLHLINSLDALGASYELRLDGELLDREGFLNELMLWDEISREQDRQVMLELGFDPDEIDLNEIDSDEDV